MMNFMGSRQGGYYEEEEHAHASSRGKLPFSQACSSSTSSSSSSQHKALQQQQQQRGCWLEPPPQEAAETNNYLLCYGGGAAAKLNLMDSDPHQGGGDDNDHQEVVVVEKEHMFDKVVTPSDVGKLNRLVIPKQHAEKYFPLDSSTNEKGLLLNFEDRNGKPWRFRYSYWNSSQSYVMTKGWSRFVKEKKLDAGDVVSFQRGIGDAAKDRLYIDWRRRPNAPDHLLGPPPSLIPGPHHYFSPLPGPHHQFSFRRSTTHPPNWTTSTTPLFLQQPSNPHLPQPNTANHQPQSSSSYSYSYGGGGPYGGYNTSHVVNPCSGSVIYLRSEAAAAPQQVRMVQVQRGGGEPMVFESVPVVHGKAAAKRLRLFGVNMECPISESDECDILSSTTIPYATMAPHPQPPHFSSSSSNNIPPLQLRLYNGSPLPPMPSSDLLNKGKPSMSLDFDI